MRTRGNFPAYTAYQKVHRASARQWPCTMDVVRQVARAAGGYDATNRRDRDGRLQAPVLAEADENWLLLENPTTNSAAQLRTRWNRPVRNRSSLLCAPVYVRSPIGNGHHTFPSAEKCRVAGVLDRRRPRIPSPDTSAKFGQKEARLWRLTAAAKGVHRSRRTATRAGLAYAPSRPRY